MNSDNKDFNNGDLTPENIEKTVAEGDTPESFTEGTDNVSVGNIPKESTVADGSTAQPEATDKSAFDNGMILNTDSNTNGNTENNANGISTDGIANNSVSNNANGGMGSYANNSAGNNANGGMGSYTNNSAGNNTNGGRGAFNGGFYSQPKSEPNAAEVLNSYLFGLDTPSMIKPPKKDSASLKKLWKTVGVLLLTMAVAFSGAFACFYWVCNTALLGDSDFFRTLMVQASGVEVNKVEVDMVSGSYEEDTVALAEKIKQYSIDIQIYDTTGERTGSGSGVIVSADGLALTNYHVVYGNETTLKAVLSDGTVCALSVLHLDKITDLAIVKIDTDKTLTPVTWADSSKAKAGQSIAVCGNPLGLGFSVAFGKIGHPNRDLGEVAGNFIQIDTSVNPGNSGGGLFDAAGNLIGIVNAKASGTNVDGIGYAIPAARALDVMDQLLEKGYVGGRPAIGLTLVQVNQSTWDYFKNGDGSTPGELKDYLYEARYGIYIIESKYNTEIKKGDRIVSCNGVEFDNRDSFSQWLLKYKSGDTVRITVERITSAVQNPDGSYTVQRERNTYECTLRERDWADEPYAK